MRVLFFGTSPFAVPTLRALIDSPRHDVLGVVTQPDRPSGRGLQMQRSPVKRAAMELRPELPILQPERARKKVFVDEVAEIAPDVLVVAAFGQILPQRLLDLPKYGGINVHGSLLPRWRGAAPMQYALIAGDAETGVTTMQMDAGLDTGDMLLRATLPIGPNDTIDTLESSLSALGAPLLIETLDRLQRGDCPRMAQDAGLATYAPSLAPDAGFLDWNRLAQQLANQVRGVTPRPGAWIFFGGKRIKVWQAKAVEGDASAGPGVVLSAKGPLIVAASDGSALAIESVQPEGKPRMGAGDWARGARLGSDAVVDPPSKGKEIL
jgi:methionyl-tRNA formyltransferase